MLGGVISLHVLVEGSLVWRQLVAEWALVAEVFLNVAVLDMADKVGLNELVAGPAYVTALGVYDISLDEGGDA